MNDMATTPRYDCTTIEEKSRVKVFVPVGMEDKKVVSRNSANRYGQKKTKIGYNTFKDFQNFDLGSTGRSNNQKFNSVDHQEQIKEYMQ